MPPPHLRKSPPLKCMTQSLGFPSQDGPGNLSAGRPHAASNVLPPPGLSPGYQVASPGVWKAYFVRSSYDDQPGATPVSAGSVGIIGSNVSNQPVRKPLGANS